MKRTFIPKKLDWMSENKASLMESKSNTMAMFIKLFATKIVASNFLGRDSSRWAMESFLAMDFSVLV